MKHIRNMAPYVVSKMTNFVSHSGQKIVSKALVDKEHTEIRFFSFAKGEDIDKESYESESIIIVIDGLVKVQYNEDSEAEVGSGEMITLESGVDYGMVALEETKLISVLLD